jgi:hypothetical protein
MCYASTSIDWYLSVRISGRERKKGSVNIRVWFNWLQRMLLAKSGVAKPSESDKSKKDNQGQKKEKPKGAGGRKGNKGQEKGMPE